jgi:hypothetical protein
MAHEPTQIAAQVAESEWITFHGGELEGKRPKALCPTCREALTRVASGLSKLSSPSRPLCFQCYRADLERERALKAAGELDTSTDARFQSQLPFEPVDRARLEMLKAERSGARASTVQGIGQHADKRRRAQIAARHALLQIAAGLPARGSSALDDLNGGGKARHLAPAIQAEVMAAAAHAAELQLPEAWLPFVVSR